MEYACDIVICSNTLGTFYLTPFWGLHEAWTCPVWRFSLRVDYCSILFFFYLRTYKLQPTNFVI